MTKNFTRLAIAAFIFLAGCASHQDGHVVRFQLQPDMISAWRDRSDGIDVTLNREGQRKLRGLTRENQNARLEIYAARVMADSGPVGDVFTGDVLFVPLPDDARRARFEDMLPAAKRI